MKKNIFIVFILSHLYLLFSCQPSSPLPSSDYMILDEVLFVDDFPLKFSLTGVKEVDIDIIGINSFCVYDSLLIISKNKGEKGLWTILTLPDFRNLGSFLTRGEGPFEFFQSPYIGTSSTFFEENGDLCALITNKSKNELYNFNMSQSIKDGNMKITLEKGSLPPALFDFLRIDSSRYFCRVLNNNATQQIRYIWKADDSIDTLSHFNKLNQATIREDEDINILSTIIKYNPDKDRIVEMPISLNYLNLYSLDGDFAKTICTNDQLFKISKIQNTWKWNRIYTYANLQLFPDFFGVVLINEEEKTYQMGEGKIPIIQFFNWDGEPLLEVNPNCHITSFDIDFKNKKMYLFDQQTDAFSVCDISNILDNMHFALRQQKKSGM